MDMEDDDQIITQQNRGSLTFFEEEDEQTQNNSNELADDIQVTVVSCEKEGNDYSYKIRVGVAARVLVTCSDPLVYCVGCCERGGEGTAAMVQGPPVAPSILKPKPRSWGIHCMLHVHLLCI